MAASSESRLAAARAGDRTAFAELYEELYPTVFRFASFHTRSTVDAEDVAAEAFVRSLASVRSFRGEAPALRGWVLRICRNVIIDQSRRRKPATTLDDAADRAAPQLVVPDHAGSTVDRIALQEGLRTLTEDQRSTLVLRFGLDLPAREVGRIIGKTEGAVEQLQRRGLARLAATVGR